MDGPMNELVKRDLAADGQTISQAHQILSVPTRGEGFINITKDIAGWLARIGAADGLLTAFIAHTSASLTIQENSDPDVQHDLSTALRRLAPQGSAYRHSLEGADDMPAHIKSMLTSVSLSIPVLEGRMTLGTWQGIYIIEHRIRPHNRNLQLHFVGVRQNSAAYAT